VLLAVLLVGVDSICAISRYRQIIAERVVVQIGVAANSRHQRPVRSIMEILGLFANTIMASILQTTFDATLTRSFVA
jgi:hypothetical protein